MANEKGMSEDKKARLEAIRAANAAKKAAGGADAPAVAQAAQIVDAPAPAGVAQIADAPAGGRVAAGANMSDDKKAKLEAIRAANAAKKAAGGGAQVVEAPAEAAAPAAVTTRPVAATAAPAPAPAARPAAAARAAARPAPVEDERLPRRVLLLRMLVGAIFGVILCLLLATMTGYYIRGAVAGLFLGALSGLLVLSWPPERTTGEG
jgi:hypothetical protein